jgi:hypothetical protein
MSFDKKRNRPRNNQKKHINPAEPFRIKQLLRKEVSLCFFKPFETGMFQQSLQGSIHGVFEKA